MSTLPPNITAAPADPRDSSDESRFATGTQFPTLAHFRDPVFRAEVAFLEQFSDRFVRLFARWGTADYPWPSDPLRSWFRPWEYAFVTRILRSVVGPGFCVLDVGSATTFFPFFVVDRLGCDVTALDSDPRHLDFFNAASRAARLSMDLRRVPTPLAGTGELVSAPDATFDAVYSISVLEHVSDFVPVLREMARVLRPGGLIVLTVDVLHPPTAQAEALSPQQLDLLSSALGDALETEIVLPARRPADLLCGANCPTPSSSNTRPWLARLRPMDTLAGRLVRKLERRVRGSFAGSAGAANSAVPRVVTPPLTVLGIVARKAGPT